MTLTATLRPLDHQHVARLLLAWNAGDRLAADVVLDECMADPVGTPGLIFAMTASLAALGDAADPDFADHLRALLLQDKADDE